MEYTIYKITCNTTGQEYIGSTKQELIKRIRAHRSAYKGFKRNGKGYCSSFEIIKNNNFVYTILEQGIKQNRKLIFECERDYINLHPDCVNKYSPIIKEDEIKQYYLDMYYNNHEKRKENQKKYDRRNKQNKKLYYQQNKDYIMFMQSINNIIKKFLKE